MPSAVAIDGIQWATKSGDDVDDQQPSFDQHNKPDKMGSRYHTGLVSDKHRTEPSLYFEVYIYSIS